MMESKTKITLLEQIRDGSDVLAWQAFSARYWKTVFWFAKNRGCSDNTAEDVVQDVMLEVFRGREVFSYNPTKGRFRDWLGALVRNVVAKHRRQPAQRIRARGGDSEHGISPQESCRHEVDASWDAAFEHGLLAAILKVVQQEVAPQTYQAFELVAVYDVSGEQAAKITGLSRNAVYLARKRVLERLKELGAPYRDNGELHQRVKKILADDPSPKMARSIMAQLTHCMQSQSGN
ncbi:MAG: sigma-70 family RNA polymerase sigma factor [Planctomycetaceae bacterium]|nr:sigma-70 family RNA polymerase sigma factor [Planctomycetaceae bacterium]